MALRFDVSRGKENRYFISAFVGYTVGLISTIIVMNWFQAAQVIDSLNAISKAISVTDANF